MLKAIANFFIAWLVLFSTIGFTLYQVARPNFIATQAQQVDLYNRLAGELDTISPINLNNIPFTTAEVHDIVVNAIDQTTFYNIFSKASNSYVEWLTGRSDTLDFSFPATGIKTNLQNAITAKLEAKYSALPVCKTSQLKGWQATNGLPACQLASNNVLAGGVNDLLSAQAAGVVNQIPDTLTVPAPSQGMLSARYYTIEALKVIELIWAITAGVILLYLIVFRSRGFISLAFIFLLAGLLEVGFGFIGWDWLGRLATDSLQNLNASTLSLAVQLITATLDVFKTILGNLSIISLASGGLFLLLGLFYKFKKPISVL